MAKYNFERLGSDRFESLAQALLEKMFRISGGLQQFGDGKDGAREATWSQAPSDEGYVRPNGHTEDINKEWVFQAKYHDVGLRGWKKARAEVESELDKELKKIVDKYKVPCHKFVLITNVPFTGVRNVGTRDKVNSVIRKWKARVPEIEVWDAVDLSRMLDADPNTRTTYLGEILPGDIFRQLLKSLRSEEDRKTKVIRAYLESIVDSESEARAQEAGDEDSLKLEKVYVDLDLQLIDNDGELSSHFLQQMKKRSADSDDTEPKSALPTTLERIPSSFALSWAEHDILLIKGGPGVGKSTLTQFLCLFHAARLVDSNLSKRLLTRLKYGDAKSFDAACPVRLPLRMELRRYSKWIKTHDGSPHFATFFAEIISRASSSSFSKDDVFELANQTPILLVLDGLDEVPNPDVRKTIFEELEIFLRRCAAEGAEANVQVILSSRPQGYRGEFDKYQPLEWQVVDLDRSDFDAYSECWLKERIPNSDEREDARQKLAAGLKSPAVKLMATTLLQATVMLTIVRRKHAIPHARHKLYSKYVEVIFEREKNKLPVVQKHMNALMRLHEQVGFDLISNSELDIGLSKLGGQQFQSCVRDVIIDFGPPGMKVAELDSTVNEIVDLAKDRLCLLAGKGENQEDIDFVIQPFREYFAAAYFYKHENASPDKLYSSLQDRQNVWANVLQFYCAFQDTAQQNNWIADADGTDLDLSGFERDAQLTKRRRALLRMLPEFIRPRNKYLTRAIQNLFATDTRWTWLNEQSTSGLLLSFLPDEAFDLMLSQFKELSVNDLACLRVELELLARLANDDQRNQVSQLLSRLVIENETTRSLVLDVSQELEIPVDLSTLTNQEILAAIPVRDFAFRWIRSDVKLSHWKGLSDNNVVTLMAAKKFSNSAANSGRYKKDWIQDLANFLFAESRVEIEGHVFTIPPYLSKRSIVFEEVSSNLANLNSDVAKHLTALLRAIEQPQDAGLFHAAVKSESELKFELNQTLAVSQQLGPSPDSFESVAAWQKSKTAIATGVLLDFLESVTVFDPRLLVHPNAWDKLDSICDKKQSQTWASKFRDQLTTVSPTTVIPMTFHSWSGAMIDQFGALQIVNAVLDVLEHGGAEYISNELIKLIETSNLFVSDTPAANRLLKRISELTIPDRIAGACLRIVSGSPEIDVEQLVSVWDELENEPWFQFLNPLHIEKLLQNGSETAIRLAAACMSNQMHKPDADERLATDVAKAFITMVIGNDAVKDWELVALKQLPSTPGELEIWQNVDSLGIEDNPYFHWIMEDISERLLRVAGQARSQSSVGQKVIKEQLGKIAELSGFAFHPLRVGAVDALLRLEELNSLPLSETDWQFRDA